MEPKIRRAIYARVSTADGRQDTENQLAELRRFTNTQGWEIAAGYIDHESGGRADRKEFRRMFADAAQRQSYGVGFRSFTEPFLDSFGIFKDAVIAILGVIAKQERIRISERVRAGLNRGEGTRNWQRKSCGQTQSDLDREKVTALRNQGRSWREIAGGRCGGCYSNMGLRVDFGRRERTKIGRGLGTPLWEPPCDKQSTQAPGLSGGGPSSISEVNGEIGSN